MPNHASPIVILSYHPSYNQDFFRTLKSPHPFSSVENHPNPLTLSFDDLIPYRELSRQILPYHLLSLVITHLLTKIFPEL